MGDGMNKADKEIIRKRLERITESGDGVLTPEAVLKDAKKKGSPLHSLFEWDDTVAAHKWRTREARKLITSVHMEIQTTTKILSGNVYVRNPRADPKEQGYIPIMTARDESDIAYDIMRSELAKVLASLERARGISELLGMKAELEDLLAKTTEIEQQLQSMAS